MDPINGVRIIDLLVGTGLYISVLFTLRLF